MISRTLLYVFIFTAIIQVWAPSGLGECVNWLFWLRECVKMEKKLHECVNWKNLRERENQLLDCKNAWICPIFAWICEFSLSPRSNISPIFPKIFPDFPKNRVCVNFQKNFRECVNCEKELRECVNFGSAGGPQVSAQQAKKYVYNH